MKVELFIDHFTKEKKILNTSVKNFNWVALERFLSLKGFFKYIEFQCGFDEKNKCKNGIGKRCCCSGCHDAIGYLTTITDKNVKFYARHFLKETGFWREGKGCFLPHKLRSITCLTHHCNGDYDPLNRGQHPGFSMGMLELKDHLKELRSKFTPDKHQRI